MSIVHTATDPLERFIPISRQEIQNDLLQLPLPIEEQPLLKDFCQLIVALYHFNFHRLSEQLKQYYQPFNPDTDIITKQTLTPQQLQQNQQQFIELISKLLNHANYEQFSKPALETAIADGVGQHGLAVTVDLDDYEAMLAFYRGSATQVSEKRTWKSLFLWKQRCEVPIYKRVVAVLKFKSVKQRVEELIAQGQTEAQAQRWVRKSRGNLPEEMVDNHIFLKLFKNVPRLDIEVLFPNQQIRFKLFDKIRLAVTGGGGTIGGIIATVTKLAVALNPVAIAMAFAGLVIIIARQVMGFFNLHTKYMMQLSRNLYFHNLDNNLGVVGHLVDAAEEEECKEAILAYYFLHTRRDQHFNQTQLDQTIESYLREKYDIAIDFEVADGVRKLRELGLLSEHANGQLQVVDLSKACELLDTQWDEFFQYHH